jgi:hypothetical protein
MRCTGSHTCAHVINTRIALATTWKGTATMADYFSKMKSYANDMAAYSQLLSDEDFTPYVLTGIDEVFYNPLVSSIVTRVEPISLLKLCSQMLSYELHIDKQSGGGYGSQLFANAVARGRGTPYPQRGGRSHGRVPGHGTSSSSSRGGYTNNSNY